MSPADLCQFFTHPYVANFMAQLINPKNGDRIIDPACGEGVFFNPLHMLNSNIYTYGCEIDKKTSKEARFKNPHSSIYLHNGLYTHSLSKGEKDISEYIQNGTFDSVIANPPFYGIKNKIVDPEILSMFECHVKDGKPSKSETIEVLFIERFIQLLKPEGKICTIIPEGIMSDKRLAHFRNWLLEQITVEAIISLPEKGLFGDASVNVVILCGRKKPTGKENKKVFFAKDITLDDLPVLYEYMKRNKIFVD